ncbi:MAG: hypothetical protein QF726_08570, partial [Alphaproteobacteria bacterium]|nr:hypothetical protein [Alphaproteobacteria bacterium]
TKETAERKERIKQVVMCGRPLVCKENLSICGLVDSGHVSGLFARYHLTAGLDGFRAPGPIQVCALTGA